jgi:hypothetical protein
MLAVTVVILLILVNKSVVAKPNSPKINTKKEEDLPISFGYKTMWFAIKTNDHKKLEEILGIKNIKKTNWETGIEHSHEKGVFITPNIGEWIIVTGCSLPSADSKINIEQIVAILNTLSNEFGDAHYFCTHRVVELHAWVKSINGQIQRVYSYVGESGENIVIKGNPTTIEKQYLLINTFSPESKRNDYYDNEDLVYPDEELVMKIAENWSVNPTTIDNRTDIKGSGSIGKWVPKQ